MHSCHRRRPPEARQAGFGQLEDWSGSRPLRSFTSGPRSSKAVVALAVPRLSVDRRPKAIREIGLQQHSELGDDSWAFQELPTVKYAQRFERSPPRHQRSAALRPFPVAALVGPRFQRCGCGAHRGPRPHAGSRGPPRRAGRKRAARP